MRYARFVVAMAVIVLAAGPAQAVVTIDMVTVGSPGNTATMMVGSGEWHWPDAPAGAVADVYRIGKYEVTAGQYTEFLNAKATTDDTSLLLYNGQMGTDPGLSVNGKLGDPVYGCHIDRSGVSGSYTYTAVDPDLPVNYVSWGDAARFTNWMHNGQGVGDMEAGVYALNGANTSATLKVVYIAGRDPNATIFLPNLDEWVKAAHYDQTLNGGAGGYYVVPTSSDVYPAARTPVAGLNTANIDVVIQQGNTDALLDVGTFFNTTSPYGAFDMAGNINEWIGDTYIRTDWGFNSLGMGSAFAQPMGAHNPWAAKSGGLEGQNNFRRGFRVAAPGPDIVFTGDFDNDGDIDADDINILCANLGGDPATYDVDQDGDVDEDDMIELIETLVEWDNGVDSGIGTKQGDFNLDGIINATDLAIMKGTFGSSGVGYADGNANCDIVVNATDLAILKTNFGFTAPTGGGVPEPVTVTLLAVGAGGLIKRRRRPSRR